MKKHIKVHLMKAHSEEWYEFRKNGVGGSEIGAILGLSNYKSSLEVFHEKVGLFQSPNIENEPMFHGTELEDYVMKLWQYWGPDGDYIDNFRKGIVIRKCRRVNGYITNPKYPWLFSSVDRLINKNQPSVLDWEIAMDEEKVLECKTISGWLVRIWESGIPPYHLAQIQSYMTVLEVDYAELAILVDGRKLDIYGVKHSPEFSERILQVTGDFWNERVLPARELMKPVYEGKVKEGTSEYEDIVAQVYQLEPDPDGSEAYKNFMNERYKEVSQPKESTSSDEHACKEISRIQAIKKLLDEKELLHKNSLRASMGEFDEMKLTNGKVTWRSNAKNTRVMRVFNTIDEQTSIEAKQAFISLNL